MNQSIDLIEDRTPRNLIRRELEIGERVRSWLVYGNSRVRVKLIDISLGGLGAVTIDTSREIKFQVSDVIQVLFIRGEERYSISGEVVHVKQSSYHGKDSHQVGIQLKRDFVKDLATYQKRVGRPIVQCKTYIRPQISCDDPFYFLEHLYFQINGFSASGIDVVSSIRNNSLLPGQPLSSQLFVPGRGVFRLKAEVSNFIYRANSKRLHVFFKYKDLDKKMLEAVSEYLILFGSNITPKLLRSIGFPIGDLARAVQVTFQELSTRRILDEGMIRGVLGVPTLTRPNFDNQRFKSVTKGVLCKLGPHSVARAEFGFVGSDLSKSKFLKIGHELPKRIQKKGHLEITNFFISPHALLSDFFMHFIQHAVRIAAQNGSSYVVVEAAQQLTPILKKIGFRPSGSSIRHKTREGRMVIFDLFDVKVENVLRNFEERVEPTIWEKVYKELNHFLAKPSPYEHGQARPYFINQSELKSGKKE